MFPMFTSCCRTVHNLKTATEILYAHTATLSTNNKTFRTRFRQFFRRDSRTPLIAYRNVVRKRGVHQKILDFDVDCTQIHILTRTILNEVDRRVLLWKQAQLAVTKTVETRGGLRRDLNYKTELRDAVASLIEIRKKFRMKSNE